MHVGELMSYWLYADRLLTDIVVPQKSRLWKMLRLSNALSPGKAFSRPSRRDADLTWGLPYDEGHLFLP